jgi:hypothetical protein
MIRRRLTRSCSRPRIRSNVSVNWVGCAVAYAVADAQSVMLLLLAYDETPMKASPLSLNSCLVATMEMFMGRNAVRQADKLKAALYISADMALELSQLTCWGCWS